MPVKIIVIGDTHVLFFENIPLQIKKAIQKADLVVHVGDYNTKNVFDGFIRLKGRRFRGVYGNADPLYIRNNIDATDIIELEGKRIGITHPSCGGPENLTKRRVLAKFKKQEVDIILYGHTHEPKIEFQGNILMINPGKGYIEENCFGPPTSFSELIIGRTIKSKIINIEF